MLFRKRFLLIPVAALFIALVWGASAIIYADWRAGHSTHGVYISSVNWPLYKAELAIRKLWRKLSDSGEPGLPQVRLYVSEKSSAGLMSNIPDSTKQYQRAHLRNPDGTLEKVKIRYRGDNPINWLFEKKSIRLKLSKKKMRDNVRVFNYGAVQTQSILGEYIALEIGRALGLNVPQARPVELFVNDESWGVVVETERMDETFLRNRNIMPVNIYKGEQYNSDHILRSSRWLFENPSFWSKTAYFNRRTEQDNRDLGRLINLLSGSSSDINTFRKLVESAPIDEWAKYAAFQVLTQSLHNDDWHNLRLLSDVWTGEVIPLPFDTSFMSSLIPEKGFFMDAGSNEILGILHHSSEFLFAKYQVLFDAVNKSDILNDTTENIRKLRNAFVRSSERDASLIYLHYYSGVDRAAISPEGLASDLDLSLSAMNDTNAWLNGILGEAPSASWQQSDNLLTLVVENTVPAANWFLELDDAGASAGDVYWDFNGNRKVDPEDILLPSQVSGNGLLLDTTLLANRIQRYSHYDGYIHRNHFFTQPTRFEFLLPSGMSVVRAEVTNPLSNRSVVVKSSATISYPPIPLNVPIFQEPEKSFELWSGEVPVSKTRIIRHPVRIAAGTTIHMAPGTSIVFRDRVLADGTPNRPIIVAGIEDDLQPSPERAWGVFALQGEKTAGSRLMNVEFRHGSGAVIDTIAYTGMLSLHDTANVVLSAVRLLKNHIEDDSLHVVYADNICVENLFVADANGDGVDIDISAVMFIGGEVNGSSNDGIDLMSSMVLIDGMQVSNSGDKGISVGERTNVAIASTSLSRNHIGIESKDTSNVVVIDSELLGNMVQLNAYRKNWQYGGGGKIFAYNITASGSANYVKADKKSEIHIHNSTLAPQLSKQKHNIHLSEESDLPEPAWSALQALDHYHPSVPVIEEAQTRIKDSIGNMGERSCL